MVCGFNVKLGNLLLFILWNLIFVIFVIVIYKNFEIKGLLKKLVR